MKKILLTLFSFTIVYSAISQSNSGIIRTSNIDHALKKEKAADGSEMINGPIAPSSASRSLAETTIGTTVYDLQTNGTSQRRIVNHSDGTISAVWTMDNGVSPYANRGAGYNYHNGTSWGAFPTNKVESTRNGWPALSSSANADNEIIVSHSGTGGLTLNQRSTKGSGLWKETIIPTTIPTGYDVLWPRAVVGGSNDSTIHVIAIVRSSATPAIPYRGLTNALVYYRSQNLGNSWDIQDSILPGLDSSVFTFVAADAYSIDASGNTVAFAVYNSWGDVLVFKSANNGDTWTPSIVSDFPINKYAIDDGSDINNDGIIDTIESCDGSGSMMIDNLGTVHVFYGLARVLDADTTDDGTSYFPGTNGLAYWNEGFGNDSIQVITGALDLDGSGTLEVVPSGGSLPSYQVGMSSMPSCGVSANNTLYLVYAALAETHSDGVQTYRHLYVMNSTDGGATWSDPEDYTPDFSFAIYEAVYPSMAKHVDSNIHIIYQRDFSPGHSISGDLDPAVINDIVYLSIDTMLAEPFVSVEELESTLDVSVFPNPANDLVNVRILADNASNETLTVSVIDATGRTVYSLQESFNGTAALYQMNVSNIEAGVYFVRIESQSGLITKSLVKK